jgi:hypothetical protein
MASLLILLVFAMSTFPYMVYGCSANQINSTSKSAVPSWYLRHRVHAHTRLAPAAFCNVSTKTCAEVFENAAQLFHELGVPAFVRHSHEGSDMNWWQVGMRGGVVPTRIFIQL